MKTVREFIENYANIAHAVIRRGAFDLLFKSIFDDRGTSCGIVYCHPAAIYSDAENTEAYYDDLFSLSKIYREQIEPVKGRVVVVSSSLGPGGSERQISNTLVGLRRKGIDIHYLGVWLDAAPDNRFHVARVAEHDVPVHALERRETVRLQGVLVTPTEIGGLLEHLPEHALDIILNLVMEFRELKPETIHAWLDEKNIFCGIAAVICGVPNIILSCRSVAPTNFPFHRNYMRPAYRALLRQRNVHLLNNSKAGAQSYSTWLEYDRSKIKIIRNAVEFRTTEFPSARSPGLLKALGISEEAPVVGSIFRLGAEKRPMLWLDTARWVLDRKPDCQFILIGDGPMREEMISYATELGLVENLHMLGVRDDIDIVVTAMDAFLLTSEIEGLPNVLMEAQYLGVPVVAPSVGGVPEAVNHGRSGFLCDESTPGSLGALLVGILEDSNFKSSVKSEGPEFVEREFSMEKMLSESISVYRAGVS